MVNVKMFRKIQQLKKRGYGKLAIGRKLNIDPATVRKYYNMKTDEYHRYRLETLSRDKLFDSFKDEILSIYESNNYQKLNMSGVYDYLEEKFKKLPGSEKSLRNYIHFLERTGELKYKPKKRFYARVEELPYGKQMQLDFGQYKLNSGLKLYIFALVLSASRYKYVAFQDTPFRTMDVILHLLDAFDYFQGYAEQLVIDQDALMVSDENYGEIIYTKSFDYFIKEMGIKMYVCRKADPESKGKIENLIKYVKYNFLSVRDFETLKEAEESLKQWLYRRANGKISQATKKVPLVAIEEERKYLKPIKNSIYRKTSYLGREERIVSDKSCIMVEGKEYSIPIEYRSKKVEFYKTDHEIFIFDAITQKEIASHKIPKGNIKKVTKREHFRYKSLPLNRLEEEVLKLFNNKQWKSFVEYTTKAYQRYRRDQYALALSKFSEIKETDEIFKTALGYCLDNKTYGMKKLYDTYMYMTNNNDKREQALNLDNIKNPNEIRLTTEKVAYPNVQKRPIASYEAILVNNQKGACL